MARNIIVVGGVALGPKAACRFKRLEPDANVILIDQAKYISYGGCGIPFYVAGDVSDVTELQTTSFHMVRDEKFFRDVKDIHVLTRTRVLKIDREKKTVLIRKKDGQEEVLPYDKLVLGTGSVPRSLPIPGQSLKNVFTVSNLKDAIAIKEQITKGQVEKAVIIGGGFIGLEMAEALSDMWEIETSIVELFDQIMPGFLSKGMAQMALHHLEENGITCYLEEKIEAIEGEEFVKQVKTDKRTIPADVVIMAVGVVPASDLAKEAGLDVAPSGAIVVNEKLQTSDPDIYAGGDCVQIKNLISGKPAYFPLGSMANHQGRVIGTNLAGGEARFEGAVGSFVVKIFDISAAGAGLSIETAKREGFDAISIQVTQLDRAHFYPEKELMYLELVVEKDTRRVLGIQGLGSKGDAMVGRINAVASTLKYKPSIEDISNLEIAYSPPFSAAMDIVNALGNVAENAVDGRFKSIDAQTFAKYWEDRESSELFFLDCRDSKDAKPFTDKYPGIWKNIPQDELKKRIDEVPPDKKIILVCNTGVRSYEAQLNLRELGLDKNISVQGGMATLKKSGIDI
jgi:NADPH-dependent 2,4-dienoyl-CoA reductase/sulfur reductase-like enzyme/rhodanese-related sulfurtransferase